MRIRQIILNRVLPLCLTALFLILALSNACRADLAEVKQRGVLRHLGVPYANFVTGSGDGLDVDLITLFAKHLGVKYEFVKTSWPDSVGDLTGKKITIKGNSVEIVGEVPPKGDIAAHGITIVPWREKILNFVPNFPTQVWLVAREDSAVKPIKSSQSLPRDIKAVKATLKGRSILGMANTCLDHNLYGLEKVGSINICFQGSLNDMVPAIMQGEAEMAILDILDAIIALAKWPGKIKVVGPLSDIQMMGVAFDKNSPQLQKAFQEFMEKCKKDGTYVGIVKKYEPAFYHNYPELFKDFR
jgi:ABC-type amino acid transport substrate-binding protein